MQAAIDTTSPVSWGWPEIDFEAEMADAHLPTLVGIGPILIKVAIDPALLTLKHSRHHFNLIVSLISS